MPTEAMLPAAEAAALTDLLESEGWAIYERLVRDLWGADAVNLRLREKIKQVPLGDPVASQDMVQHILRAQDAVESVLQLPKARLITLTQVVPAPRRWTGRRIS